MLGSVVALVLSVTAAPPVSTPPISAPAAKPQAAAPPPVPQSVWNVPQGGSAEHLQTGLKCPGALGDFRRTGIVTYDGFGLDVSCGYSAEGAAITVYLTRSDQTDKAYANAKTALMRAGEARHPVLNREDRVPAGQLDFRRAQYAEDDGLRSDIWIADLHGWVLEYRASYGEASAAAVSTQLAALTDQVLATAGARLGLCARSAPPPRPGREVKAEGPDRLAGALVGGAAGAAALDKGRGDAAQPVVFCVEAPVAQKDMGFLAWRGVTPGGENARVDRLTAMTMGAPPTLETAFDAQGSVIAGELAGGKTPERWTATVNDGARVWIYAYYEGRPSAALLAPLMSRVLTGKAQALGGYGADGETIQVTVP